ncbi:MAG TPA: Gfo/Idh/MocA family oxidoreductase [Chloroflexota bacterium]|nr:Gfo/Idh/MocA family oxidoreductase [Chloroflexota bacterium]
MVKHRIGLVGCGGIAHRHLAGYRAVVGERGAVVAACDPHRATLEAFAERYGIAHRFLEPRELLVSGEVDVISLLTPPAVRGEVIFPALERGIAVLVEKPFATSLADARAFVEAADRHRTPLAVNQQLRFMPDVLLARELLTAGRLGEVRLVAHDQFQNRTRTRGWRSDESRLEISIFSIHLLDRIRWLVGRPPLVVSATTRHWSEAVRGETFTALTVQFEGGAVGTMVSSWHALAIPECRLRVDGTAGSLLSVKSEVVADECHVTVQRPGEAPSTQDASLPHAFTACMGESMRRLLEAMDTGTEPVHSGRDNLHTMAIVDGAYLSAAQDGAAVSLAHLPAP